MIHKIVNGDRVQATCSLATGTGVRQVHLQCLGKDAPRSHRLDVRRGDRRAARALSRSKTAQIGSGASPATSSRQRASLAVVTRRRTHAPPPGPSLPLPRAFAMAAALRPAEELGTASPSQSAALAAYPTAMLSSRRAPRSCLSPEKRADGLDTNAGNNDRIRIDLNREMNERSMLF